MQLNSVSLILSDLRFWHENQLLPPLTAVNKTLVALMKGFQITELMGTLLNLAFNLFYLEIVLSSLATCFHSVLYHISLWDISFAIILWMNEGKITNYQRIQGRAIYLLNSVLEMLVKTEFFFQEHACQNYINYVCIYLHITSFLIFLNILFVALWYGSIGWNFQ